MFLILRLIFILIGSGQGFFNFLSLTEPVIDISQKKITKSF